MRPSPGWRKPRPPVPPRHSDQHGTPALGVAMRSAVPTSVLPGGRSALSSEVDVGWGPRAGERPPGHRCRLRCAVREVPGRSRLSTPIHDPIGVN